jgi:hypothetical protein
MLVYRGLLYDDLCRLAILDSALNTDAGKAMGQFLLSNLCCSLLRLRRSYRESELYQAIFG